VAARLKRLRFNRGTPRQLFIIGGAWACFALITLILSLSGVIPRTDWSLSVIWLLVSGVFVVTGFTRMRRAQ
jgi:hypothetical protein